MGMTHTVANMGLDCHRNFSQVSARDQRGRIVWRQRLPHADRAALRERLQQWPKVPVVMEASFGWGWMSDELKLAGLDVHLSSGRKVAGWREARGLPKSNKRDADLLSELWSERPTMQHGVLKRAPRGEWATICCPAHKGGEEQHPSMRISLIDGHFRCMACGASGGDLIALHRLTTGLGFRDAVRNMSYANMATNCEPTDRNVRVIAGYRYAAWMSTSTGARPRSAGQTDRRLHRG